jgi:hypothetical protein
VINSCSNDNARRKIMYLTKDEKKIIIKIIKNKVNTVKGFIYLKLKNKYNLESIVYTGEAIHEFNVGGNDYIIKNGSKDVILIGIQRNGAETPERKKVFVKILCAVTHAYNKLARKTTLDVITEFRSELTTFISTWKKLEERGLIKSIPLYRTAMDNDENMPMLLVNDGNSEKVDIETYCLISDYIGKSILVMPDLKEFKSRRYRTVEERNTQRWLKILYLGAVIAMINFVKPLLNEITEILRTKGNLFQPNTIIIIGIIVIAMIIYRDMFR